MKQINGGRVKRGYEILFTPQRKALVARTLDSANRPHGFQRVTRQAWIRRRRTLTPNA